MIDFVYDFQSLIWRVGVGVWLGWGLAYLPVKFFSCPKLIFLLVSFLNVILAIRGNDFNFCIFSINEAILGLVERKETQKSTLSPKLTPVFWQFWSLNCFKIF